MQEIPDVEWPISIRTDFLLIFSFRHFSICYSDVIALNRYLCSFFFFFFWVGISKTSNLKVCCSFNYSKLS